MSNGIYPHYVGPDISYRTASLYPSWLGSVADVPVPVPVYDPFVGFEVLFVDYGVTVEKTVTGGIAVQLTGCTEVLPEWAGVPIPTKVGYSLGGMPGALKNEL